jgi:hypothetical protein
MGENVNSWIGSEDEDEADYSSSEDEDQAEDQWNYLKEPLQ